MRNRYCFAILIPFIVVLLSTSAVAQNFKNIFLSDSIACDTFPPPRNLDGYTQDDAARLWWEVPLLNPPENLLGYNLYRNNQLLEYIEYDGADTTFYWDFNTPWYDLYTYYVTSVYDLSPCGFPGDTAESDPSNEKEFWIGIEFLLPFIEEWNTGSFDPNLWDHEENWSIIGTYGNPPPSALFNGSTIDTNYSSRLTSYGIQCKYHPGTNDPYIDGDFFLEFDIQLNDLDTCGIDRMTVQYFDTSMVYNTIIEFSDTNESFPTEHHIINMTEEAKGNHIKISFLAEGDGGSIININNWYIDNIEFYRQCHPPRELQWVIEDLIMAWRPPIPHTMVKKEGEKDFLGYNIYYYDGGYEYLDFTTDTFYELSQSYDYFYVTAVYEDCEPASNELIGHVGVDHKQTETSISIYPNPANNSLGITASSPISKLSIIDLSGRIMMEKEDIQQQYQLNTSSWPNGIYVLEAIFDHEIRRKKIVIRH